MAMITVHVLNYSYALKCYAIMYTLPTALTSTLPPPPPPLRPRPARCYPQAWPLTELSLVPRESPENASLVVVVGDGTDEGGGEGIGIAAPEWKTR